MKKSELLLSLGILLVLVLSLSGCGSDPSLSSITVTPQPTASQLVTTPGETAQFMATGTYKKSNQSTSVKDITDQVQWESSDVGVATINSAGTATAGIISGTTTISATSGGVTGSTILTVQDPSGAGMLPTLAVYMVGPGSGNVTSDPAGINCTSGAGCTGSFQLGERVVLTEAPTSGSTFSGWSSNCTPLSATTCTVTLGNNAAVGIIFNK